MKSNIQPDMDRVVHELQQLVAIQSVNPYDDAPTPNFREQEAADWLVEQMQAIGMEVSSHTVAEGRPNVWGRLKGSGNGPTLMLAGHTDTVAVDGYDGDPFDPRVEGGRVYGRGSVDMKGPLVTFLEVARIAKTMELKGDLVLAYVCDEEDKMIGSTAALEGGMKADFCIVGEPSMLTVCTAHKGQLIFKVEVEGLACHSSGPEKGVNAIGQAAELMLHMRAYNEELKARDGHELCEQGRFTPVLIEGGETHSTVPGGCAVRFDRRTLPGETVEAVTAEIEAYLDVLRAKGMKLKLGSPSPATYPLDTSLAEEIVVSTLAASSKTTGVEQTALAFPGGTDAPNFGCPTVICGPGDLAQAHTINEYIEIDQMRLAVHLYLDVVQDLLG
ncbi:MAG: M20 family metallopeptidase [Alphaproteobacteria bacterium]